MNNGSLLKKIVMITGILFFTSSVYAKINIPGELTADAVWTKDSGPYEIEKDFLIRKGATLTIEPGVKIIFKAVLKTEPNTSQKIKFTVEGKLIANGTSEEKIIFTSTEDLPGLWSGIVFQDTKENQSVIEYCQIERATCGIVCLNSSPVINNNFFTKNELAIDCEDWSSPVISNNTFIDNGLSVSNISVIYCARYSSPKIKNNLIQKNVGPCIFTSTFSAPEISQNTLIYNTSHGISINSFSQPTVINNEIAYNGCFGQQGINVHEASPIIMGNYIHDNCKIGISVSSNSNCLISGNKIINNEESIICVDSSPNIVFNIIKDFQYGIVIGGNSSPSINYNNLQSNDKKFTSYIKMENCGQQINAQNNWWNTDNTALIVKGIVDVNTNPSLGAVVITPYLNSEVMLNDYVNVNLEYLRRLETNKKYTPLKNNSILFLSFRDGNWEIYSSDPKGNQIKNLTNNPSVDISPCWSPDGQEIAFSSNRSGNLEIYVMKNNGADPLRLTDNIFNDSVPVWSPDGKKIAYYTELRQIYLINRDGSNKKSVDPEAYGAALPGFFSTSYLWLQDN